MESSLRGDELASPDLGSCANQVRVVSCGECCPRQLFPVFCCGSGALGCWSGALALLYSFALACLSSSFFCRVSNEGTAEIQALVSGGSVVPSSPLETCVIVVDPVSIAANEVSCQ